MLRAMIVDDEMMVRTALAKMVDWQAEGFVLDGSYSNGQAALDALKDRPADLIFTDIRMPVCDGLELIDRVHEMCIRDSMQAVPCPMDILSMRPTRSSACRKRFWQYRL